VEVKQQSAVESTALAQPFCINKAMGAELDMGRVHPRVGSGRVGSGLPLCETCRTSECTVWPSVKRSQ